MENKQIACPECGSVTTLARCWIGMEHECNNCRHVFKISTDDICLSDGSDENSPAADSPVSFTCPTCGEHQSAAVRSGETMARCKVCSSMVNISSIARKTCPYCRNMISSAARICPVCKNDTMQIAAVRTPAAVQTVAAAPRRGSALKVTMLVLLAVAVLAGGGYGAYYFLNNWKNKNTETGSGEPQQTADGLPEKIKRVDQSVVCIIVKGSNGKVWVGSGFAVSPRYIITNRHVAAGAQNNRVVVGNPKWKKQELTATVREISQAYDLAWLVLDDETVTLKPMVLQERFLEQGDKVYTLGYPGYSYKQSNSIPQLTVADGIIKSNNRIMDRNPCYESSATINGGNSGGPLVDESFRVVGVNTFKMKTEYAEGCFYSIRVEAIKSAFPDLWKEIKGE